MFKEYQSKPIIRRAYKILKTDYIVEGKDNKHFILKTTHITTKGDSAIEFVAHEKIKTGDYIVYLNAKDIYHCNAKVFAERNIIE